MKQDIIYRNCLHDVVHFPEKLFENSLLYVCACAFCEIHLLLSCLDEIGIQNFTYKTYGNRQPGRRSTNWRPEIDPVE
jgi:hypothetical protein